MHYRHLLVPLNFHDPGGTTLQTALDLASQHQAQTTLMYVIEAIDDSEDDDRENGIQAFYAELEADIREKVGGIAARFEQEGLPVRAEIVVGHGPREIVQYSASESVDLIVMRSERVDLSQPDQRVTSVSHQVSLFCQCPVMLVK